MAIGLGSLFQNMLKLGVKDAAKEAIPDMVGRMFAKQEPTTDEVLQILEDERRQRAVEFVGGGPDYYQDPRDDAPNIVIPEPLVQTPTGSVIPQQTIVPQVIDAPRGTVVRNLGGLFLEVERINANIAAMSRAMNESARLEKKYRDELIKNREQLLAEKDKQRSRIRESRARSQSRGFFGKQLRRGQRKARGMTQGLLDATLFSFALELGGFIVDAVTKSLEPPTEKIESGNLRDIISGGEGGLNSVNRGTAGDTPGGAKSVLGKNLTELTVDEVSEAQKSGKIFAAGKYQVTPATMPGFRDYLKKQGVDTSTAKFDKDVQNMFFDYTLESKRPEVGQYLRGENVDIDKAALELAAEFASVGVPYDMKKGSYGGGYPVRDIRKGESLYSGIGNNAASISPDKIKDALKKQREVNETRRKSKGGPDIPLNNKAMPSADQPGAPGIPGDPNAPKVGEKVGSAQFKPMSSDLAMAPVGQKPKVSVIEQYYDMQIPQSPPAGLGKPNEIPDRNPGGGGMYEQYMGVA